MSSSSDDVPGRGSAAALADHHDVDRAVSMRLREVLHEIQAPILSLRLRIESLAECAPEALSEAIDACHSELRELENVSRRLLQFDQLESTEPRSEPVEWSALFERIRRRFEPIAASADVALSLPASGPPSTAQDFFYSDAERIQLILSNLLDNALRHAPAGTSVSVRFSEAEGGLRLAVCDQGPGVPTAELPHLFEPFHRTRPGANDDHRSGFGLGLSLCRAAASALGGHLEIESDEGKGTTAGVFLPSVPRPSR